MYFNKRKGANLGRRRNENRINAITLVLHHFLSRRNKQKGETNGNNEGV